jgi:hypothetical protein
MTLSDADNRPRDPVDGPATADGTDGSGHIALAVPLRAAERNRQVAASVLAGGLATSCFFGCCRSA